MMKTAVLAFATLAIASGSAMAAQNKYRGNDRGHVNPYERVAIAKASAISR